MTLKLADVNRLMDNARIKLPGALDGTIQLEIFNTLDDFFKHSNVWQERIDFAVTPANTRGTRTTIVPDAGLINRLMFVMNADFIQRPMSMSEPGELTFLSVPNGNETWTAHVALTIVDPVINSGRLAGLPQAPGWVMSKYSDGLLSGVLGRMMMQLAKPYSNPKLATFHTRTYERARSQAKNEVRHGNIYGGQTWRFPQGFVHGHQRGGNWGVP